MAESQHPYYREIADVNKGRFEAFSDGVFAFAITLLILGIALPAFKEPVTEAALRGALLGLWPNFIAYALSFAVIGIMWQNHHALFRSVARLDRGTVLLNLLLLGGTVCIPFATSLIGEYPAMHTSTFFYGLVLTYCSVVYNLMLHRLIRVRAFAQNVDDATTAQTSRAYFVGLFIYSVATLVALAAPLVSFAAYIAIALYYLVPRGVDRDLE